MQHGSAVQNRKARGTTRLRNSLLWMTMRNAAQRTEAKMDLVPDHSTVAFRALCSEDGMASPKKAACEEKQANDEQSTLKVGLTDMSSR